jgi:hypothetical protein
LGFDGLVGYNVIRYARECLGAALATQKLAGSLFGNGIRASGTLEHPGKLKEDAQKRLRDSFSQYQGSDSALRLMILEEGMKFNQTTIPPEEAQFLESRQFSVSEICRWFRMPPHKVADLTRATFSNIEQQSIEYVGDTLMPWLVRWEQEIYRKLLTRQEQRKGLFARHTVNGLLRGDATARANYYKTMREWGVFSADDIRELEEMNPIKEGKGDIYLQPLNYTEAGEEPEKVVETAPPKEMFNSLVADAAERIASAETREIEKVIAKAKENRDKFNKWAAKFFAGQASYMKQVLLPIATAWTQTTHKNFYLGPIVDQLVREGAEAFTQEDLDKLMPIWREKRREDIISLIHGGMNNANTQA